ncbi:hypothetical protein KC221_28330, partial [Mycobacterium tuberculosis]|nr:hypothetical protein [Mycobacterium tuberculosis]
AIGIAGGHGVVEVEQRQFHSIASHRVASAGRCCRQARRWPRPLQASADRHARLRAAVGVQQRQRAAVDSSLAAGTPCPPWVP